MEKHDKSNDGQLNFEEFKVIFRESSTTVNDVFEPQTPTKKDLEKSIGSMNKRRRTIFLNKNK